MNKSKKVIGIIILFFFFSSPFFSFAQGDKVLQPTTALFYICIPKSDEELKLCKKEYESPSTKNLAPLYRAFIQSPSDDPLDLFILLFKEIKILQSAADKNFHKIDNLIVYMNTHSASPNDQRAIITYFGPKNGLYVRKDIPALEIVRSFDIFSKKNNQPTTLIFGTCSAGKIIDDMKEYVQENNYKFRVNVLGGCGLYETYNPTTQNLIERIINSGDDIITVNNFLMANWERKKSFEFKLLKLKSKISEL